MFRKERKVYSRLKMSLEKELKEIKSAKTLTNLTIVGTFGLGIYIGLGFYQLNNKIKKVNDAVYCQKRIERAMNLKDENDFRTELEEIYTYKFQEGHYKGKSCNEVLKEDKN